MLNLNEMINFKEMTKRDPRDFQLMVLTTMLIYGVAWLKFDRNLWWLGAMLATAYLSQLAATRFWRLPRFEWKSAMISGLSLCILMRCSSLPLSIALTAAAILSKFVFRWNGKHIFNPTNFALALGILTTSVVSIDPGQWNNGIILALFIFCMGTFVSDKACRSDVSFAFLATYAVSLMAYTAWTNGSFEAAAMRLQTGSLLIFTFFMISDPRSTPNSRTGRVIFGTAIALVGIYLQLAHGFAPGLIVSLVVLSIVTPFIDKVLPAQVFQWSRPRSSEPLAQA